MSLLAIYDVFDVYKIYTWLLRYNKTKNAGSIQTRINPLGN